MKHNVALVLICFAFSQNDFKQSVMCFIFTFQAKNIFSTSTTNTVIMIYIILCSEAANQENFTTSIRSAYNFYKKRLAEYFYETKILSFREFSNYCIDKSVIYQVFGAFEFIDNPTEENFDVGLFAMQIKHDERF